MPNVVTKSFGQLVNDFATAVQGSATALLDFGVGSVLLAIGEAVSGVSVWLESLILLLLATTRLATSSGNDVDTFVNDFGVYRLPAVAATGQVTFSRFTATMQAQIQPGVNVVTADGTQAFTVIADTTQSAWNAALGCYVLAPNVASALVTVQALSPGTQGNVAANTITVISSSLPYIDQVTNTLPFTSGANAESDAALRARFIAYFASLAMATRAAIIAAVVALQVGATCVPTENYDYNGTYDPGSFYCVVDDGSGSPTSSFLSNAFNAVDRVRACGIRPAVYAPQTVAANVAMQVTVASGYTTASVYASVQSAITLYLASLVLGQMADWAYLATVAYAVPGVATVVPGWTLNGAQADLTPTSQQRVIPGSVVVT